MIASDMHASCWFKAAVTSCSLGQSHAKTAKGRETRDRIEEKQTRSKQAVHAQVRRGGGQGKGVNGRGCVVVSKGCSLQSREIGCNEFSNAMNVASSKGYMRLRLAQLLSSRKTIQAGAKMRTERTRGKDKKRGGEQERKGWLVFRTEGALGRGAGGLLLLLAHLFKHQDPLHDARACESEGVSE